MRSQNIDLSSKQIGQSSLMTEALQNGEHLLNTIEHRGISITVPSTISQPETKTTPVLYSYHLR